MISQDYIDILKRAQKNYSRYVSCDPEGCAEGLCKVKQLRLGTDTGTGGGVVNDTDPQLMSGVGNEFVEGSSVQQRRKEFGELAFLLGEPNHYINIPTGAAVMLFEQAVSDPRCN